MDPSLPRTLHASGSVLISGGVYYATCETAALAERLAACYAACEGIATERLVAVAEGVSKVNRLTRLERAAQDAAAKEFEGEVTAINEGR